MYMFVKKYKLALVYNYFEWKHPKRYAKIFCLGAVQFGTSIFSDFLTLVGLTGGIQSTLYSAPFSTICTGGLESVLYSLPFSTICTGG